jgi:hypothetical protein
MKYLILNINFRSMIEQEFGFFEVTINTCMVEGRPSILQEHRNRQRGIDGDPQGVTSKSNGYQQLSIAGDVESRGKDRELK